MRPLARALSRGAARLSSSSSVASSEMADWAIDVHTHIYYPRYMELMRSRAALEGRLSDATFRARAPPDVQARDEGLAADLDARLAVIQETLERLEGSGR